MSKQKETFGEAALATVRAGSGGNVFSRAVKAAITQFGNGKQTTLPKTGKDTPVATELEILKSGMREDGKATTTIDNRVSQFRKVVRVYPIYEDLAKEAQAATLPTYTEDKSGKRRKKKPRVEIKNNRGFSEQVMERVLTVASAMVTDQKPKTVADLPTVGSIVDAWVKKENAPKKKSSTHPVVSGIRTLNNIKTSGKYAAFIADVLKAAKTHGIAWEPKK